MYSNSSSQYCNAPKLSYYCKIKRSLFLFSLVNSLRTLVTNREISRLFLLLRRSAKYRIRDAQECIKVTIFWQDWACKVCRCSVLFGYLTKWEPELVRDISRSLWDFFDLFFNVFEEERIIILARPRFYTDSLVWPFRSEETLSWGISRLRHCDSS